MTIGCSDQEPGLALAVIPPPFEQSRKLAGCKRLASFVQDDIHGTCGRWRRVLAAVGELADLCRPVDALQVSIDQVGLGSAADLAPRDDVQEHAPCAIIASRRCC